MDPTSLSNLDPKLRETYERVMGASASSTPTPAAPVNEAVTPATPTPDVSTPTPTPIAGEAVDALSAPLATPAEEQPATVTISQPLAQASSPIMPITQPHGHSGLIKVFYILGGVVFFIIYTVFCFKIFNLKLPF